MRLLFLTVLLALALAAPASAEIYNVNTTDDGTTCAVGDTCTLRGALIAAGQSVEGDTINLQAAIYTLSARLGGELVLQGDVAILGRGANQTTIESPGGFRVLRVDSGEINRVSGVTIAGGTATSGGNDTGGNILLQHGSPLTLDHVRVTRGTALRGGGIATQGGSTLQITHSLIDNNVAQVGGQSPTAAGGGIVVERDIPQTVIVSDSTIAFNRAGRGAGISTTTGNTVQLTRVTIADNAASSTTGGGVLIGPQDEFEVQGSIFARNTGNFGQAAPTIGPSNCGPVQPTDAGGNVESAADCGFDLQNTTAGLATTLTDDGGMTPVLPISYTSPARELAGACTGTDQRDVPRPEGALCDAGAYEALPPAPPAATPTPTPTAPGAQATPTPPATPTPVVNKTIVAALVRGTVKVKVPGAKTFENLDVTRGIPVGSTVDTRKGRVRLTSIPKAGAPPETAEFYDGLFKVTQARGITNLTLTEQLAPCSKANASAAATKPKSRKLWGSGKGAFRTSGKYSAATVRGTRWLVQDSCASTLTRVTQGSVYVRDSVRHRTFIVRSGKRYTARPRR